MIFFIISPLLCLIIALKSYRTNWAKNIIWAFAIFYGFTFVISSEGIDAFEYARKLSEMHHSSLSFSQLAAKLYTEEEGGGALDFVQPLLTFLVSLFTDNYHILFGTFSIVFGFFYSRNIWLVLDRLEGKIRPEILFLLFLFAMVVPLWMVNGVRMWTAAHMFFYGAFPYLIYNKKKSLIWCIISIFMHFSFIFPLCLLGLFILVGNRSKVFFWLLILSFFFTKLNLSGLNDLMQNVLPSVFQSRIEGYTNVDYAEGIADESAGNNLFVQWYGPLLQLAITLLLVVAYWRGKRFFENNPSFHKLIGFTFLLYGCSNLLSGIPSFQRFITFANLFAVTCIIFYLHYAVRTVLMNRILPFAYIAMLFYITITIRIGFDTIGVITIIGNPVTALFKDTEIALIQLFKR